MDMIPKLSLKKQTDGAPASEGSVPKKRRRKLPVKRIVALVVVAAVAVGVVKTVRSKGGQAAAAAEGVYTTAEVERRDITAAITGSGTLEAADSYSVTTLKEGTILSADFQEGDQVQEGTVLYTIDSSDAATSLEQSQLSVDQAKRNYNNKVKDKSDLTVTAPAAGRIVTLDVEVGDDVNAGQQVATLRDSDTMKLKVPFPADDAEQFYVGQSATVTLDSTFETLTGTVSAIDANTEVLTGNMIVHQVTIEVSNPGGLSTTQSASAQVAGVGSTSGGTFQYEAEKTITAKTSGTVSSIRVSEGTRVSEGQTVLQLTSDDLDEQIQSASDNVRNAELSYSKQAEQLDDYTITAPITGTIVDKNYNAGETTEANKALCTIYDLSYLTMTLSVDELDISDIAVGQTVSITADAVEDKTYTGTVTKVSVAGTSSGSATTYPVTIRIDETDGLLPGMNVDATIELESASSVLSIPAAALNRGNTVLVTADSPSAVDAATALPAASGAPDAGDAPADGEAPEGDADKDGKNAQSADSQQYVSVQVTTGVSDGDYIEIVSGLQEGDVVAYIPTSSSSGGDFMMMGPGGGMPGGDMGGAPSGGGAPGGGPGGGF